MVEFCTELGLAPDAMVAALARSPDAAAVMALAEAGRVSQREFELTVARQLAVPSDGLVERLVSGLLPRTEMFDLAARARAAGVRTGVLSNSLGGGGYDIYTGYDLNGLFDVVVISHEVELRKPERPIYELAAAKLGLRPRDCALVDDTEANVLAARDLGMAAVHFTGEPGQLAEVERLIGLT